jgi:hypothetical protein
MHTLDSVIYETRYELKKTLKAGKQFSTDLTRQSEIELHESPSKETTQTDLRRNPFKFTPDED